MICFGDCQISFICLLSQKKPESINVTMNDTNEYNHLI